MDGGKKSTKTFQSSSGGSGDFSSLYEKIEGGKSRLHAKSSHSSFLNYLIFEVSERNVEQTFFLHFVAPLFLLISLWYFLVDEFLDLFLALFSLFLIPEKNKGESAIFNGKLFPHFSMKKVKKICSF